MDNADEVASAGRLCRRSGVVYINGANLTVDGGLNA